MEREQNPSGISHTHTHTHTNVKKEVNNRKPNKYVVFGCLELVGYSTFINRQSQSQVRSYNRL